jgi:hypothetical protein
MKHEEGQDSSVGLATGYGLDDWDSIFVFSIASRLALGPTQPPIQRVSGALSPGVKRQGRGADHSPSPGAEVKTAGATASLPNTSSWHGA